MVENGNGIELPIIGSAPGNQEKQSISRNLRTYLPVDELMAMMHALKIKKETRVSGPSRRARSAG